MARRDIRQAWIQDRFVKIFGIEAFFPESTPLWIECGYKYTDLDYVSKRSKSAATFRWQWVKAAKKREAEAVEAEKKGHLKTAHDEYHRAALYYGRAQWSIFEDNDEKAELHGNLVSCFDKMMKYNDYPMEKVEIPFGNRTIPGILHLPLNGDRSPCVIFIVGRDMMKEEYPNPNNNIFLRRGMAVLSIDGPGYGESNIRKFKLTLDNFEKVGKACVDYLETRKEIDSSKIGACGVSFGSYLAPRVASYDHRLKSVAVAMGSYYARDRTTESAAPIFLSNIAYMTGVADEEEVTKLAGKMSLEGLEDKIQCGMLLIQGQFDELCPEKYAHQLFDRAVNAKPRRLEIYENQFHPLGGVIVQVFDKLADWTRDRFDGKEEPDDAVKVFVKESG